MTGHLRWLNTYIKIEVHFLQVLHLTVRLPGDIQAMEFNLFFKNWTERDMCALLLPAKRGNSGCLTKGGGRERATGQKV